MIDNRKLALMSDEERAIYLANKMDKNNQKTPKMANFMDFIENFRGEPGYTPEKGVDYFTDEEIKAFLEQVTPIKGEHYFTQEEIDSFRKDITPVKGIHYNDGEKGDKGNPGKNADETKIVAEVLKKIPETVKDTANEIAVKLNTLKGGVSYTVLKDVPEGITVEAVLRELKNPKGKYRLEKRDIKDMPLDMSDLRWHGGGISAITAGAGITITETETNKFTITATAVSENYKDKVSAADTTPDYLGAKLVAGTGISIVKNNPGGNESLTINASTVGLTPTAVKSANYTANPNELIPIDLSSNVSFAIQLPTAPVDGTLIQVQIVKVGTTGVVEMKTGGTDVFIRTAGPTSAYMALNDEVSTLQYQSSTGIWFITNTAATSNFAMNFPGIDMQTPITNANITIDTSTRILTVTPPLGYFNIFIDGGGKIKKFRKTTVNFPAFTDTSGMWFFYFDSTGTAVTTQTPWLPGDFGTIAAVYRIIWNSTLAGAAKLVAQYIEYHENSISADDHQWFHLQGTQWVMGFVNANNAIGSGTPATNGSNAVIGLTTGENVDDNLEYTVTNDTSGNPFTQDLGNTTPASLTNANGGQFKVYTQDGSGNISFIAANRFPFSASVGNVIEKISSTGVRTAVTSTNFLPVFVYATQNPVSGEAVKVVPWTADFTTLANAQAINWVDVQNTYSTLGNDPEIRPLYRLIYESRTAYDVGTKKAALRSVQDLRKSPTTSTATATGSLPATSVTVVPVGLQTQTNAQSAIDSLETRKVPIGVATAGQYVSGEVTDTVSAGAVTVDWSLGNVHYMVLGNGATTITLTNPIAGGRYLLYLKQPPSGAAGTVTFSPVPICPGGVAPTLTITNNAVDAITLAYSTALSKYVGAYNINLA